MGYAARTATVPTFHAKGVGLAFDICKNVKGHEYDDPGFFTAMGRLGKEMGFTWGGDWRSFPDRPHFQWWAHHRTGVCDTGAKECGTGAISANHPERVS